MQLKLLSLLNKVFAIDSSIVQVWERPDLCDYVLNENSLTSLYQKAAENAKENLMVYSFIVYANEECIKQGQFSK